MFKIGIRDFNLSILFYFSIMVFNIFEIKENKISFKLPKIKTLEQINNNK